jgi:hypothetical protein
MRPVRFIPLSPSSLHNIRVQRRGTCAPRQVWRASQSRRQRTMFGRMVKRKRLIVVG